MGPQLGPPRNRTVTYERFELGNPLRSRLARKISVRHPPNERELLRSTEALYAISQRRRIGNPTVLEPGVRDLMYQRDSEIPARSAQRAREIDNTDVTSGMVVGSRARLDEEARPRARATRYALRVELMPEPESLSDPLPSPGGRVLTDSRVRGDPETLDILPVRQLLPHPSVECTPRKSADAGSHSSDPAPCLGNLPLPLMASLQQGAAAGAVVARGPERVDE